MEYESQICMQFILSVFFLFLVIEQSTTKSTRQSTKAVATQNQSTVRSTSSSVPTTTKATQTSPTYNPTTRHTSVPTSSVLTTTKATITTTKATSTSFTTKRQLQCPPKVPRSKNLMEFANHCYEFILGVHKKWPDAELDCNHRGGHVVSIGSSAEQTFLYQSLGVCIKLDIKKKFNSLELVPLNLKCQSRQQHFDCYIEYKQYIG